MNQTPLDAAITAAAALADDGNGIARIAAACKTSRQFIFKMRRHWRETGRPPRALREYAQVIESATAGGVRAEVLYPEVDWLRDSQGSVTGYVVHVRKAVDEDTTPKPVGDPASEVPAPDGIGPQKSSDAEAA